MTTNVARLALPFTDTDLNGFADVRIVNDLGPVTFTVTVPLPSVGGINGAYYNGGDLGTGDTSTFAQPDESFAMAFAEAIANHGSGFNLTVSEDPTMPGRYVFTRAGIIGWSILWTDVLTTFNAEWLGFDNAVDSVSVGTTTEVITAPYQADRLWRATRPTWNRRRRHKKTSHAKTWSGDVSKRQLSAIRVEWSLRYSAQVGARVYIFDGTIPALTAQIPGMAVGDPNVALESLWDWIASRGPLEYWADESTLTASEYAEPSVGESLETVLRVVTGERSGAPPVYDLTIQAVQVPT
jgi:hypothetical protein